MRIGLTGGIGAGKSTVSAYLAGKGAHVIDYDAISHAITAAGGAAIPRLREVFGDDAIAADGSMDRSWVASRVFGVSVSATAARNRLDGVLHPMVYAEARRQENAIVREAGRGAVIVHDIPLLAEIMDELPFSFHHIVVVEASRDVRIERMMANRGMTRDEAERRMASQADDGTRRSIADIVVTNDGDMQALRRRLDDVWRAVSHEAETSGQEE